MAERNRPVATRHENSARLAADMFLQSTMVGFLQFCRERIRRNATRKLGWSEIKFVSASHDGEM